MNQVKYIFAQLTEFSPCQVFDRIVVKYPGISVLDPSHAGIKCFIWYLVNLHPEIACET